MFRIPAAPAAGEAAPAFSFGHRPKTLAKKRDRSRRAANWPGPEMDLAFAGFGQDPSAFATAAAEYRASAGGGRSDARVPRQPMAAPELPAPSAALEALSTAVGNDLAQGREQFHSGGLREAAASFRQALARVTQARRSGPSEAAAGATGAPACAVDLEGARAGARIAACAVRAAGNAAACAMAAGQAKEAHWLCRRALGIWAGATVAASLAGTTGADGTPAVSPQGLPKAMVVRLVRCCVRLGEAEEARWAMGTLPRLVDGAAAAAAAEGSESASASGGGEAAAVTAQLGAEVAALEAASEAAAAVAAAATALPRSSAVAAQVCSAGPEAAARAMDLARDAAWRSGSETDTGAVSRQGEDWRRWLGSGVSALACLVAKGPAASAGGVGSLPALLSGSAGSLAAVYEAGSEPWAAAALAAAASAGASAASVPPGGDSRGAAAGGQELGAAPSPASPAPFRSAAELSLRLVEARARWSADGERAAALCAEALADLVPRLASEARARRSKPGGAGRGGAGGEWGRHFCAGARAADLGCEAALAAAERLGKEAALALAAHAERELAELEEDARWVAAACVAGGGRAAEEQIRSAVRAGRLGAAGQAAASGRGEALPLGSGSAEPAEERALGAVVDAAASLAKTARAVMDAAAAADASDATAASPGGGVPAADRRRARSAAGERLGAAVREAAAGGLLSVAAAAALMEACRSVGAGLAAEADGWAGGAGAGGGLPSDGLPSERLAGAERAKEWCVTAVALRPRSAAARVCAGCALWALRADAAEAERWVRGALAATRCFEGLRLAGASGGGLPTEASGGGVGWAVRPRRRAADWALSGAEVVGCSNAAVAEAWQAAEGGWGDMAGAAARMALRSAGSHPGPLGSLLGAALGAAAALADARAAERRAAEARAAAEAAAAAHAEAEAARRRAQRQRAREAEGQRDSAPGRAGASAGADAAAAAAAAAAGSPDAPPMPGSHYDLLGVPFGAAESDIKRAYRRRARDLHPDKASRKPGATEQSVKQAEEQFKAVTSAYEVLCDPAARADYDGVYRQAQEAARRAQAAAVAASARAAPVRPADPIRKRRPRRAGAY
uniref:J domain-containing protein n=1 Tax=Cafeteria roenbergensis TaxID=33653 RepID=A0A7S0PEA0_CAFRO